MSGGADQQIDAEFGKLGEFAEVIVESRQSHIEVDADCGDEQIHGRHMQARVARFRGEFGCGVPDLRRGGEHGHGFQPAQELWTLPARSSAEKLEAHLFAKQRILGVYGGIRNPARGFRRALAQVVDPDAGVDYLSHGLLLSSSCMAS